jgi:multiple sugar transport system permease protein
MVTASVQTTATRDAAAAGAARPTRSRKQLIRKAVILTAVGVWLTVTLGPYVVMLLTSLTPQSELIAPGSALLPSNPTFAAYQDLYDDTPFLHYLGNSAVVAIGTVVVSLLAAATAAISLSRFRFQGRRIVLTSLLVAQLFPAVLLVIPLQGELRELGLLNSRPGLILINATFATPFAVWLLKGFLDSLPRELDEAAKIDGCSSFQLVRHILLPLMKPGLTAAGTYIFIFSWNEFLYALTFTQSVATQTVPVGLHLFIGEYQIRWDLLTAGGVVAAIPVLVGFMLVQRNLIDGLTAGAVKG